MKFLVALLCASVPLMAVDALSLPDFSHDWNALKVSWYANPLSLWGFDKMPRTLQENAVKNSFALKDDFCATGRKGKFLGQRYWYKQDPALILLYDVQGTIAGIQTAVPKAIYTPSNSSLNSYFINDGDYWSLTAYFVDPKIICSTGRTTEDLQTQGTGTGLYIQTGPNPVVDFVRIPMNESDIKKTNWGHGKCFWTMGQHYWYNITKDMSCDEFVPVNLLYNGGKLTAFGWTINAQLDSPRYDHPSPTNHNMNKFLDPVPDCFFSDTSYRKLSALHVYFIESPRSTSWC